VGRLVACVLVGLVLPADPIFATDSAPAQPDTTRYELQVIHAKPGKLDALHAWFQAHQANVLARHGATNIGYFTPAGENPDGKILCVLKFPNLPAVMQFSRAVKADPLWRPFDTDLGQDNPEVLVEKVEFMHLRPTDFSPAFEPGQSTEPRVFELRTYNCPSPEMLARLHERFREYTMKLFAKHGMENLIYWQPLDGETSDRQLVYLLAHKSQEAAKASFAGFRADPAWIAAKKASEEKAGGSLTNPEGGVVSEFYAPTAYSPLK
jgi:hypothetical protein